MDAAAPGWSRSSEPASRGELVDVGRLTSGPARSRRGRGGRSGGEESPKRRP